VGSWFQREFVHSGKLPLLLCFLAFIVTFLTTRTITRMIRAGKGPFKDNVASSGVHVHHIVPGIILLTIGAITSVGIGIEEPWASIAGVIVGTGLSLVLDEFALVLRMQDVYWAKEGRISVEMVALTMACLGFLLVSGSPFADDVATDGSLLSTAITLIVFHLGMALTCVLKGKYKMALFGLFVPLLALVSAFRLARPGSRWSRRYQPKKLARAERRATRSDRRWQPLTEFLSNTIAGKMNDDEQVVPT
jgi:hypothetical protein